MRPSLLVSGSSVRFVLILFLVALRLAGEISVEGFVEDRFSADLVCRGTGESLPPAPLSLRFRTRARGVQL